MENELQRQQIAEWQQKIEVAFTEPSAGFTPRLKRYEQIEQLHAGSVSQLLCGFHCLVSAFQDFALQTSQECLAHVDALDKHWFAIAIPTIRRYRAAVATFYLGYYFDAGALLRGIFENALYLGAVKNGFIQPWAPLDGDVLKNVPQHDLRKELRKVRQKHDAFLRKKMIGEESGLSVAEQESIENLVYIFHSHVHRAESSALFFLEDWRERRYPPPVSPEYSVKHACRVSLGFEMTAWLLLRVLPFVSKPECFSDGWKLKYEILDRGYETLMEMNAKPANRAVQSLIEKRFTFDS